MEILIDLVKLGAIGASLAFLYLSYDLLRKELALTDSGKAVSPRLSALAAIAGLSIMALVFFVVGVMSEFILTPIPALTERLLSKQMVRAYFYDWKFSPENPSIEFAFQPVELDSMRAVEPKLVPAVDIYVAVRKKGTDAPTIGKYPLLFGPYTMGNTGIIATKLNKDDALALGAECAQFTAIGVIRTNDHRTNLLSPFDPDSLTAPPIFFDTAGACVANQFTK